MAAVLSLLFLGLLPVGTAAAMINGTIANIGEYPFVARIQEANGNFCTGSLIDPGWVLTAGHCLTTDDSGTPSKLRPASFFSVTVGAARGIKETVNGITEIVPQGGETRGVFAVFGGGSGLGQTWKSVTGVCI